VDKNTSFLRLVDSMIRYYYKLSQEQLDALDDQEWAEHFADLEWLRSKEAESSEPSQSN
jgi:hypothetical protein